jgi:hypothetical protein
VNRKRTEFTAEHAETAEVISAKHRSEGKKISLPFRFSGTASLIFVFLCALSELCGEILLGMTSDFIKFHMSVASGRERPVKSKKKLCRFGVVPYESYWVLI